MNDMYYWLHIIVLAIMLFAAVDTVIFVKKRKWGGHMLACGCILCALREHILNMVVFLGREEKGNGHGGGRCSSYIGFRLHPFQPMGWT
jgi:hypothetical protein